VLKRAEQALTNASAAQLHALCAGGLWMGRPALTYTLLARPGDVRSLAYRFLLARGQALCAGSGFRVEERARNVSPCGT